MIEITHWQNKSGAVENSSKSAKQANFRQFEAGLLASLMDSTNFGVNSTGFSGLFSQNTGSNLLFDVNSLALGDKTKALEEKLKNIQDQGMGKVLAAQLSNPLPNFGQTNAQNTNKNEAGGLNNMITLTIQAQMIKARRALADQFEKVEKSSNVLFNESSPSVKTLSNHEEPIAVFISNIQAQIASYSNKYSVSEEAIKELL